MYSRNDNKILTGSYSRVVDNNRRSDALASVLFCMLPVLCLDVVMQSHDKHLQHLGRELTKDFVSVVVPFMI